MQAKIDELSKENSRLKDRNNSVDNKVSQEMLTKDVMCFGVPSLYADSADDLLDSFSRYFGINLDKEAFSRIQITKSSNPQTTMRMVFGDMSSKKKFMKAVDAMSRDATNKRHPIVLEDIFEELKSDPSPLCGKTIHFANSMTKTNQEILKLKKEIQPFFLRERDGHLYLKKDKRSREEEVHSVSQVRALVASYRGRQQ
jgi:hypothetical protein